MPAPSAAAAESGSGSGARSRSAEPMAELGEPGRHVAELLKAIPDELLARAAFACGAHARALLYFETHVARKGAGDAEPGRRAQRHLFRRRRVLLPGRVVLYWHCFGSC